MSDELNALRNELTTWYMSLDQRTQGFFDAAYAKAPEAVTHAIGGQAVAAEEVGQYSTLAAMLGADAGGDVTAVVPYMWAEAPTVETATAQIPFTLRWTVRNYGAPSSGHLEQLVVVDESGTSQHDATQEVQGLDKGGEAPLEVQVPGLRAGRYIVRILHNARGVMVTDAAYASRQVGISSMSEASFEVGAAADAGGIPLDHELVRKANDKMRPLSLASHPSHHYEAAEAIDSYLRAFGEDASPFAGEVANLHRLTTAARDSDATDTTVFNNTPSAATVVATGEAFLAGQATARQLLDALTAVAGELSSAAPGAEIEDPAYGLPDHDTPQPRAAPAPTSTATSRVAPQQTSTGPTRTLSSDALRSASYEDTEPDPYVNLADETSGGTEGDAADQS